MRQIFLFRGSLSHFPGDCSLEVCFYLQVKWVKPIFPCPDSLILQSLYMGLLNAAQTQQMRHK